MNKIKYYYGSVERNHGFTLIEILIAMLILTVAILSLVSVTVMVIKGNSLNRMITTATTLAKDQMETLKNDSKSSDTNFNNILTSSWSDVTGFPGYQRQWIVSTVTGNNLCTASGTPNPCCSGSAAGRCPIRKNILMQVRWQWQGNYHYVDLRTMITRK